MREAGSCKGSAMSLEQGLSLGGDAYHDSQRAFRRRAGKRSYQQARGRENFHIGDIAAVRDG